MDTFKVGDQVYVIDWTMEYTLRDLKNNFSTEIPNYSSTEFFVKIIRKPLTVAGKPWKRPYDAPIIDRIPEYKNFKFQILEIVPHPNSPHKPILLLKSKENCYVVISANGISHLTPEQYKDANFNALKEAHLGRWKPEDRSKAQNEFPKELISIAYDTDDNVLFGSSVVKGKVMYNYIPGEFMTTGRPFILSVQVSYDGKGNSDLPEGSFITSFLKLKEIFPDNTYS